MSTAPAETLESRAAKLAEAAMRDCGHTDRAGLTCITCVTAALIALARAEVARELREMAAEQDERAHYFTTLSLKPGRGQEERDEALAAQECAKRLRRRADALEGGGK